MYTPATCHPERKMRGATGLCERCYKRAWHAKNRERENARAREWKARVGYYKPRPRPKVAPTCHPDRKLMARGLCAECYQREWYAANRERLTKGVTYRDRATCHPDRKHQARGLCQRCYAREYAREKLGCKPRKRTAAEILKARRQASARRQWLARLEFNRARARSNQKKYRAKDPVGTREKDLSYTHRRRARLRDASSPGVSPAEWKEILAAYDHSCAYCFRRDAKLTRDHVVPIARGGRDEYTNVVPACKTCNSSKGAKPLSTFLGIGAQ